MSKPIVSAVMTLLLLGVVSNAQQIERIDPYGFGALTLNHVSVTAQGRVVACGDLSTILISTDDGGTWERRVIPGTDTILFTRTFWADGQTGMAVGHDGAAVRTTDGGETWVSLTTGTHEHILCGAYSGLSTVWLFGSNGSMWYSDNGGDTWSENTLTAAVDLQDAAALGDGEVVVVGQASAIGRAAADGSTVSLSTNGQAPFHAVVFADAQRGWIGTGNGILRTTNGGGSWEPVLENVVGTIQHLWRDESTGRMTASGSLGGDLYVSEDGETWVAQQPVTVDSVLVRAAVLSGEWLIAVGENGLIARRPVAETEAWQEVGAFSAPFLLAGEAAGETLAAVGGTRTLDGNGSILLGSITGDSWKQHIIAGAGLITGVAVSADGQKLHASAQDGAVYRSMDGGTTWDAISVPGTVPLSSLDAASDNAIWAGGFGTVYRTTDGTQWSTAADFGDARIFRIEAVAADEAVVCGSEGFAARTTDGGTSWTTLQTNVDVSLLDVRVDNGVIHMVGQFGTYLRSTDGGGTWERLQVPTESALCAVSVDAASSRTVLADSEGTVWVRNNDTWERYELGMMIWSLVDVSAEVVVSVGEGGAIHRMQFMPVSVAEDAAVHPRFLWPNPASTTCWVDLSEYPTAHSATVIAPDGSRAMSIDVRSSRESQLLVDVSRLPSGRYTVGLRSKDGRLLASSSLAIVR